MKYYLIAGEASGDIYGAKLIRHLKQLDDNSAFQFWGGQAMIKEDQNRVVSIEDTSFMGFWEVIQNLGTIRQLFAKAKSSISSFKPDCLILIDYPGFNLRLAKWAKSQGMKVYYYISPQLWAWKKHRYKTIKKYVDKLIVILPFEVAFYKALGIEAEYYGHPLTEDIKSDKNVALSSSIALYPGSRKQELNKHLKVLDKLVKLRSDDQFVVAAIPHLKSHYKTINQNKNVELIYNLDLNQHHFKAALVSSGTATLELALHKIPMAVFYKTSRISYWIGKQLVKIPFIALVNLIAEKPLVQELIQHEVSLDNLNKALININEPSVQESLNEEFTQLSKSLSGHHPSLYAAQSIYASLK